MFVDDFSTTACLRGSRARSGCSGQCYSLLPRLQRDKTSATARAGERVVVEGACII